MNHFSDKVYNWKSSLGGYQSKVVDNGFLIKTDVLGGEAISEVLISAFVASTNLGVPISEYYLVGLNVCKTPLFTKSYLSFMPFYKILIERVLPTYSWFDKMMLYRKNKDSMEEIYSYWERKYWFAWSLQERWDFLECVFVEVVGLDKRSTCEYLKVMFTLDLMFMNKDRHFGNFGIIKSSVGCGFAPLFDFGYSLGVNSRFLSGKEYLKDAVPSNCKFKPFNKGSKEMWALVGDGLLKNLSFDTNKFIKVLQDRGVNIQYLGVFDQYKVFVKSLVQHLGKYDMNGLDIKSVLLGFV